MLWSGRIISWVLLVTGGFTWTVGQAGLDATNRNLCELVSSISPWPVTNCHVANWLVGLWGFGAVCAFLFLAIDAYRWLRKRAKPETGTGQQTDLPAPPSVGEWLNIADALDAFADKKLGQRGFGTEAGGGL